MSFPILFSFLSLTKEKPIKKSFFHIVIFLFSPEPSLGGMKDLFSISLMGTELFVNIN